MRIMGMARTVPRNGIWRGPIIACQLPVKGGAFSVCVRPSFREPGNVETSVSGVRDGVKGVGIGETDGGFCGRMGSDSKLCAAW